MRIERLVLFLCLLSLPFVKGGSQDRDVSKVEYDRLVRSLKYDKTKKALKVKEEYKIDKIEEQEEPEMTFSGGGGLLQLVAYGLVLSLLVLILYMIFSRIKIDKKITKQEQLNLDEIEDIEDIDADAEYKAAVASGDYRLAIRMQFIKSLQTLSAAGYIAWEKEKTNRDYAREIKTPHIKRSFRELATVFERSWYGDQSVDIYSFRLYDQKFLTFFNSMK